MGITLLLLFLLYYILHRNTIGNNYYDAADILYVYSPCLVMHTVRSTIKLHIDGERVYGISQYCPLLSFCKST